MTKIALLIGVSEYGSGLNPLPGAVKDVEAVQQVLPPLEDSGFEEVKLLSNPNPPVMREAIETLFSGRTKTDLVLLFFSGHVIQDDSGKLYLATSITSRSPRLELIRVSTIPLSFVHELMSNSPCQRQVVILDCCFSSVSTQAIAANDQPTEEIKTQLGGEGKAILTSFTPSQYSLDPETSNHSVYTRYLVEGIKTGAADFNSDGWISIDELHEYASNKVQVVSPAVKPEFYSIEEGSKILLAKVPMDDPKLKYRKETERWLKRGEISEAGHYILDKLAESLKLTSQERIVIETDILKPYQEYQNKLQRYKREFAKVISNDYPVGTKEREEFRSLQQSLGLKDEDVAPIEERMALKLANLSQPEDNVDKAAQSDSDRELNSLPSPPSNELPKDTPVATLAPTNPTPASEDDVDKPAQSDSERELNSLPSRLPEDIQIPALAPTNFTPAVNFSSDLAGSQISPPSASTFPKKLLLPVGIGAALAILALAIGISTRKSVAPPSASIARQTATNSDKPSPRPSASPESKVCTILVNGNLRSEPISFRDNVVESLKKPLPVTGKQTKGGWVEVKLPDNNLAWAYQDIISNKGQEEINNCLKKNGIPIKIIEDILPPP